MAAPDEVIDVQADSRHGSVPSTSHYFPIAGTVTMFVYEAFDKIQQLFLLLRRADGRCCGFSFRHRSDPKTGVSVRPMSHYSNRCYHGLAAFELLWEHPKTVPKVI